MSDENREKKLLEQYEAERKVAEEWEDVEAGGIFSAPGRQTNKIRTAYHEDIVRDREAAEREERLKQAEEWREQKRVQDRADTWSGLAGAVLHAVFLLLLIAATVWLAHRCSVEVL